MTNNCLSHANLAKKPKQLNIFAGTLEELQYLKIRVKSLLIMIIKKEKQKNCTSHER